MYVYRPEAATINPRIDGTEHRYATEKPVTARKVQEIDPALRLVFNRRHGLFQIMRVHPVERTLFLNGFGYLTFKEWELAWELDWLDGLDNEDNPYPLIAMMRECDLLEKPEIARPEHVWDQTEEYLKQQAKRVTEDYKHLNAESSRQLQRIWEPFRNGDDLIN